MNRVTKWLGGVWAPLLIAFAWLVATAWMRPLALPDEGRYVGVAWEMLRSGNWLVPTLDGLPYFHKPPLFYWLTALALPLVDASRIAARVAPLAGAFLASGSLYFFARRWAGVVTARIVLAMVATSPLFFFGAQYANLDMLVAGCITAAVLAFAHAALVGDQAVGRRRILLCGYVACALGVLAKGLIGIVLPGMVLVLWLAIERHWVAMWRLVWWPGIAAFLVIAAPWFLLMQQQFSGFGHYFFIVQHFERFSGATFNNAQPAWFYIAVLALLMLPWSLWFARVHKLEWRNGDAEVSTRRLMAVWALSITFFFSLPHSKLVGYIFPAVAPVAYLLAGAARDACARSARWMKALRASFAIAIVLCVGAATGFSIKADRSQADIGHALRDRVASGDTVVMLDEYRFAIPFEARLRAPVVVVSDWSPAAVASRDNWRKELADAALFEPRADWLVGASEIPARLCTARSAWIVAGEDASQRHPWLRDLPQVAHSGRLVLSRLEDASAVKSALCRGTPSAH